MIEPLAPAKKPDFSALRLPSNYASTLGVKRVLAAVPVGKPSKEKFFRVHPDADMVYRGMVLELKDQSESYLVTPDVAAVLGTLVRPVELFLAVDRMNNPFFIPVPMPGPDGVRNRWHESLLLAIQHARVEWIRIAANKQIGAYDIHVAQGDLPEPTWPKESLEQLLDIAFRGKIISDLDHPVAQDILGR